MNSCPNCKSPRAPLFRCAWCGKNLCVACGNKCLFCRNNFCEACARPHRSLGGMHRVEKIMVELVR